MDFWGFLAVAVVLIGIFVVATRFEGRSWSEPQTFQYHGETFIWVLDPAEERPFGRKLYEHGSFQYADGTPVTDHRLHRMLQDAWVEQQRRRETVTPVS